METVRTAIALCITLYSGYLRNKSNKITDCCIMVTLKMMDSVGLLLLLFVESICMQLLVEGSSSTSENNTKDDIQ